ncbi:hypothetical protein [Symbiopectobacterium purcellii]|uniref:hypothetical protein n=1 Tax=Symbiopectobacterium purcellii TaxID=2871826 RepID=UPI003F82D568
MKFYNAYINQYLKLFNKAGILLSFEGFPQNAIYTDYFTVSPAFPKDIAHLSGFFE